MQNKKSKNNPLLKCIILLLFLGYTLSIGSEEFHEGQEIKWSPISNVGGYIVEVKDSSGKIIQKKQTNSNSAYLKLSPGTYEFRIIVLNKFKKIGKEYPWKELIIKPISSPIVTSIPNQIKPSPEGFPVKGEYLHKGTIVTFRNAKGEEFRATRVEPLKDGSGIIVIPPENLPSDQYTIIYQNSKGKPFESNLTVLSTTEGESIREEPLEVAKESKAIQKPKDPWPLLWRQALIPGWGHYHAGYEYTGAFYFTGSILLLGGTVSTLSAYNRARASYISSSNSYLTTNLLLQVSGNSNPAVNLINQLNLESSFQNANQKRNAALTSQYALVGFYLVSLVHVLFTAYYQDIDRDYSFFYYGFPEQALLFGEEFSSNEKRGFAQRIGVEFRF